MEKLVQDLREILSETARFLRHPMDEMKSLPDWHWRRLLLAQLIISALSGSLAGLIAKSATAVFAGTFLSPILHISSVLVASAFFYYSFQIFLRRTESFRKIATVVFFSYVPFIIFQIVSDPVPVVTPIGFALGSYLLFVGLAYNLNLPRPWAFRLMVSLYILFFVVWALNRLENSNLDRSLNFGGPSAPEVYLGK
jgi:hypothetical protein